MLQDDFFQHMREAGYTDVERGERGSSEEHLTVTQFKVEREQARLADLQTEKSEVQAEIGQLRTDKAEAEKAAKEVQTELRLLAPKLKHMEKLAAEYSSDPEDLLPLSRQNGVRQILPGEKVQAAVGEDRQGGALRLPGLSGCLPEIRNRYTYRFRI